MMKTKPKFHSLRWQILIISMTFAVVLALAASTETFLVSYRYLRTAQRQSLRNNLQVIAGEIDTDLDHTVTFLNWLEFDSSVSNYLELADDESRPFYSYRSQAVTTYERINDEYNNTELMDSVIRAVIAPCNGNTFIQIISGVGTRFDPQTLMASPYFSELCDSPRLVWAGLVKGTELGSGTREDVIPIIRPIEGASSSEIIGWVYLELSTDILSGPLERYTLSDGEALYVTLGEGNSYRYDHGSFIREEVPEGALSCSLQQSGWSISLVTSAWMRPMSGDLIRIVFVLFAFMVAFGFLMSVILRNRITRPVEKLLSRIQKTGTGDFTRDPSIEWNDEFGQIGRGINDLSENVDRMMKKQVQDERTRQELNYQILQSQINPHFMYNTLNTIKWMATIQGANGIADVSTALSRLLKNVAKGNGSLIPLREEIHLVDDYFTIMKYRYCGTIELEYRIDDQSLLDCMVNRFSLQPIVENAIFHGIEPNGRAGKITIHIFNGDTMERTAMADHPVQTFRIDVEDNGVGMTEEAIAKVLSGTQTDNTDFFRHVGVSNVLQRIRFAFGENFGITIDSEVGKYTVMHFYLPQIRMEERDVQGTDRG